MVPRIPLPSPEDMSPDQLRVYEEIIAGPRETIVGALRAAIHQPELAERWQKFGALLRFEASLPPRLSELAILVVARRWNSQALWQLHESRAREVGTSEQVIAAIQHGRSPEFVDEGAAACYDFARELLELGEVSEEIYQRVLADLESVGIVELTAILGYYTMVAMTLAAHEIPLPFEGTLPLGPVSPGDEPSPVALTPLAPAHLVETA